MAAPFPCCARVVFVLFLHGLLNGFAPCSAAVQIDIHNGNTTQQYGQAVNISCVAGNFTKPPSKILSLEIRHEGAGNEAVTVAYLRPGRNQVSFRNSYCNSFQGFGNIDEMGANNTFMTLTLLRPKVEDAGVYTCLVSYIDELSEELRDEASSDLHVNDPITTVLKHLDSIDLQIDYLYRTEYLLGEQFAELADKTEGFSHAVSEMIDKDITVAFSASIETNQTITDGQIIVFEDVITNQGDGYNTTTGVFTAPINGTYAFNLILTSRITSDRLDVELVANNQVIARLQSTTRNSDNPVGVSTLAKLVGGSVVKPMVKQTDNSTQLIDYKNCLFSGFLINAL